MRTYCMVCYEQTGTHACKCDPSQGDAFARHSDPQTSHDAAARVDATKREQQVLDGLQALGGEGTSSEVALAAGVDKWSISPRFKPLEKKGLVERTDKRRDKQIVWRLT